MQAMQRIGEAFQRRIGAKAPASIVAFIILTFLTLLPCWLVAQPEAYNWYFGNGQGLNFSTETPIPLTDGVIQAPEGCASFSDTDGNLLFYTNGGGRDPLLSGGQPSGLIWNRNHEVMYNMSFTEGGGFSAAQSSLILPKPGQSDQYLLFTMEETEYETGGAVVGQPIGRGLSLFEIDMTLDGGLGGVTVADERVFLPTFEALGGTINDTEDAYWLVIFENNENTNQFVTIFVDGSGIEPEDIQLHFVGFDYPLEGMVKISPHSQWIAAFNYIFAFDNEEGIVTTEPAVEIPGMTYGSFSPSSDYYYYWRETTTTDFLVRVDMTSSDIAASEEVLFTQPGSARPGLMQIAPNGNIYFVHNATLVGNTNYFVGEITCPDTSDPVVTPELFTYDIDPTDPMQFPFYLGLPNFADHIFRPEDPITLTTELFQLCPGEEIVLRPQIEGASYTWSDGSTADSLVVSAPGFYRVFIADECGEIIPDRKSIMEIEAASVTIEEIPQQLPCTGEEVLLTAIPENEETTVWSTGEETATIVVNTSGVYTVTVGNACGTVSETVELTFLEPPAVEINTDNEGVLCPGESAVLSANTDATTSILWSTGDTTSTITVTEGGIYTLSANNGCFENSTSFTIENLTLPTLELVVPTDSIFCAGDDVTLATISENVASTLWSTGADTEDIIVTESGSYSVTVTNVCGETSEAIELAFLEMPMVDITTDNEQGLCPGASAQLTANFTGDLLVKWSTGEDTPSIAVSEAGMYSVVVSNSCFESSATFDLANLPLPTVSIDAVPDSVFCLGESLITLTATTTNTDLLTWTYLPTGSDAVLVVEAPDLTVEDNGTINVFATNSCGETNSELELMLFEECIEEECGLQLPEIFSPNNDGLNDRFGAFTNCEPVDFELVVYSRWGKEVFATSQVSDFWQGDYSGAAAPSDAYLYRLQYRFAISDDLTTEQGSFTLVR